MKTRNKILYIVICLVIVIGIVMWKNKGFNLELQYSARDQINISNKTGINKDEVNQIVSDVLQNSRYFIQDVETFGNAISIVADEITDEQKNQIIDKFNEKYGTDIKGEDIEIVSIPFTRIKDAIKPYILPGIVTTVIILLYFGIRFKDLKISKVILETVIDIILSELFLFSVFAICRIPFGRVAIALGIGLYAIVIAILTEKFENEREKKIAEKQEQTERN
ncbi:MAG: hypothetical protein HFJ17_03220 [Clostridia bacterium]|nr:hypothetical protein [Clostridia bacterium]